MTCSRPGRNPAPRPPPAGPTRTSAPEPPAADSGPAQTRPAGPGPRRCGAGPGLRNASPARRNPLRLRRRFRLVREYSFFSLNTHHDDLQPTRHKAVFEVTVRTATSRGLILIICAASSRNYRPASETPFHSGHTKASAFFKQLASPPSAPCSPPSSRRSRRLGGGLGVLGLGALLPAPGRPRTPTVCGTRSKEGGHGHDRATLLQGLANDLLTRLIGVLDSRHELWPTLNKIAFESCVRWKLRGAWYRMRACLLM